MLDRLVFEQYMGELSKFYGRDFSEFALEAWFAKLEEVLSDADFVYAVSQAIAERPFMPSAKDLVSIAREGKYDENAKAYEYVVSLPSREMVMSVDEQNANLHKIRELIKSLSSKKSIRKNSPEDPEKEEKARRVNHLMAREGEE